MSVHIITNEESTKETQPLFEVFSEISSKHQVKSEDHPPEGIPSPDFDLQDTGKIIDSVEEDKISENKEEDEKNDIPEFKLLYIKNSTIKSSLCPIIAIFDKINQPLFCMLDSINYIGKENITPAVFEQILIKLNLLAPKEEEEGKKSEELIKKASEFAESLLKLNLSEDEPSLQINKEESLIYKELHKKQEEDEEFSEFGSLEYKDKLCLIGKWVYDPCSEFVSKLKYKDDHKTNKPIRDFDLHMNAFPSEQLSKEEEDSREFDNKKGKIINQSKLNFYKQFYQ